MLSIVERRLHECVFVYHTAEFTREGKEARLGWAEEEFVVVGFDIRDARGLWEGRCWYK